MKKSVAMLFALVVVLAACSSHPQEKDAIKEVMTDYCGVLQKCYPPIFAEMYTSTDDCVQQAVNKTGSGLSQCTQEQVDACDHDIKNLSCGASIDTSALPTSCKNC